MFDSLIEIYPKIKSDKELRKPHMTKCNLFLILVRFFVV